MNASHYPSDYRHVPVQEAIARQAGVVIEEMRRQHPSLAQEPDLALLRYCISFRDDAEAAGAAAAKAVAYRKENAAWLAPARRLVEEGKTMGEVYRLAAPHWDVLEKRLATGVHRTTVFGGPISYIRAGLIDLDELMDAVGVEELTRFFIFDKEVIHTLCDIATKKNGFITKALYVMDGANLGVLDANRKFFKAMGDSSKVSEFLHPQLVQRQCVINAASSFKAILKIASVFLSKKTLDRFVICKGFDLDKSAALCPYASKWIRDVSELPTFCGGTCNCEGGCVGGVPNDFMGHKIDREKRKH
jgi:hypothetical protein